MLPDAEKYYKSFSGYMDELAWAATWLYKATKDSKYLTDAENHWNSANMPKTPSEFSWDNKGRGAAIMLAHSTNKAEYINNVKQFCDYLRDSAPKTPQGMVYLQRWGSNRHAANVAFACMAFTKYFPAYDYNEFARKQIHLMLGDAGRSYVVGFGNNPPTQPHHRGASCKDRPASCGWADFASPTANPQILYGALVGGPDKDGIYNDLRSDFTKNEITVDFNAGYQSVLAGLLDLQSNENCGGGNIVTTTTEATTSTPQVTTTRGPFSPITVTNQPIVLPQCNAKYNYSEVVHKSLLFYEAQRSGVLPASNRIPWRRSSTTRDGRLVGRDLTGGYFDAGDFVKFNFPGAAAITLLAWGMVDFKDGYLMAGEYQNGLTAIKWATDYFMQCHAGTFS